MTASRTETTTCVVCHADCSNRPRVRDAADQFYCWECYEKEFGRLPVPVVGREPGSRPWMVIRQAAAPDAEPPVDESLAQAAGLLEAVFPCPDCRRMLPIGTALCTHCGLHLETGRKLGQARELPSVQEIAGHIPTKAVMRWVKRPSTLGLAAGLLLGGLFAAAISDRARLPGCLIAILAYVLVVHVWSLAAAFRDGLGTGIMCLFVPPHAVYFALAINQDRRLKFASLGLLLAVTFTVVLTVLDWARISAWVVEQWSGAW